MATLNDGSAFREMDIEKCEESPVGAPTEIKSTGTMCVEAYMHVQLYISIVLLSEISRNFVNPTFAICAMRGMIVDQTE